MEKTLYWSDIYHCLEHTFPYMLEEVLFPVFCSEQKRRLKAEKKAKEMAEKQQQQKQLASSNQKAERESQAKEDTEAMDAGVSCNM